MSDDRTFYGPHPCSTCGKTIVRASHQQGGEAFDQPDGPIYPNTDWHRHACASTWEEVEAISKHSAAAAPSSPVEARPA